MQQEDLFENSAMERLEAKKLETIDVLAGAPNGWEMQYFLTGEEGYRGYVLLVKFEKSGQDGIVHFAAKNEVTGNKYIITDGSDPNYPESYFDVVFDNGPVLTFNSYNNLFHKFSDPKATGVPGDQGLGTGLGGDYEFVVINADSKSPDQVLLKGKKRGTYTVLKRLPENLKWEDYFKQLEELNNDLYNNNPAPLLMVAGGNSYYLYNGATSIFSAVETQLDDMTFASSKKFLQTNSGIRFDVPYTVNENTVFQELYFNSDKSRMEVYVDGDPQKGVLAYIENASPLWFYNKNLNLNSDNKYVTEWVISEDNMGAKFKEKYDAFKNALDEDGMTGLKLYIGGLNGVGDALQFDAKNLKRTYYWKQLSRVEDNEGGVVKYSVGERKSSKYDDLLEYYPQVNDLVSCFDNVDFKVEIVRPFNLNTVRLVSVSDPEMSFEVTFAKK